MDLTDLDTFANGFRSVACCDEVLRVLNDPVTFSSETGDDRPPVGTIIPDLPVAG